MADVIFSGYVVPNKEKNITEFKVTELFKDRLRGSNFPSEKLKYKISKHINIDPSIEYIFYSKLSKGDDDWLIWFLGCSRTGMAPEEKIKLLRNWKTNLNIAGFSDIAKAPLIFKGRVIRREIYEGFRQKRPLAGRYSGRAMIEFEVQEIYKNELAYPENTAIKKISVHVGQCAIGYELGKEYLMYVDQDIVKSESGHAVEYRMSCAAYHGVNYIDEKQRLRRLSKFNNIKVE